MKILPAVSFLLDERVLRKPFLAVVVFLTAHWESLIWDPAGGTRLVYGRAAFPRAGGGDMSAQAAAVTLRSRTMLPSVAGRAGMEKSLCPLLHFA